MTEQPVEPLLLRVDDAAKTLSISRSVMYELIRAGTIKSVSIGRSRLISKQALIEYITYLENAA